MKRLVAWILMLCMVMSLLCGCDIELDSSNRRSDRDDDDDEEIVEDRDDEDRDDEDLDDEDRDDEDRDDEDQKDKDKGKDNKKVTIDEVVVYDENDIKITVTGLEESSLGQEIKIQVENNTDRNITLSGDNYIVNGISMNGFLFEQVAAGKKAKGSITFYTEYLENAGVEQLATVDCVDAYIYDSDSYEDLYQTPFIIETSIAGDYVQEIDDSGEVVFEEAGVTVISKGIGSYATGGVMVRLLVKNETGRDILIQAKNVSVNGYTIDGWMYNKVMADTVCFCDLSVMAYTLEENGIDDVEDISFSLAVRYVDEWDYLCESDELTFTVN